MHGARPVERGVDRMSTAELPAPTTSTRLPLSCSLDFTSCECNISPSNVPGYEGVNFSQ